MHTKKPLISASILSANFARLGEEVKNVLDAGADMIHFDVMDNHYVPNLTVGPIVCKALRKEGIKAPIDVHLMVEPVDELIVKFAKARASCITFHPEASKHIERSLQLIKDNNCFAGLVLNPATPICFLADIQYQLDILLIMTVNPGFGGQKFIPEMLPKIKKARELLDKQNPNVKLAVDGGINKENIADIAHAGADILVIGSAIFKSGKDYKTAITELRHQIGRSG